LWTQTKSTLGFVDVGFVEVGSEEVIMCVKVFLDYESVVNEK
jgi:hypothetical protein